MLPNEALEAFASLGTSGNHAGNQERDLHRWMSNLWGFSLQTYSISVPLQDWGAKSFILIVFNVYNLLHDNLK